MVGGQRENQRAKPLKEGKKIYQFRSSRISVLIVLVVLL
jgi:hypothetical protein